MEAPTAPVTSEAPAAAPVVATPTVSASFDAAAKGDFGAFLDAENAATRGTPKARVEVPATPATPAKVAAPETPAAPAAATVTPPAQVSKRQQQINDYERRIAEQDQRIRALESGQRPSVPAAPAQPAAPTVPEWKRIIAMPDAPKLADFESVEEHAAAMAVFVDDTRRTERETAERTRTHGEQLAAEDHHRISAFDTRVTELAKTDPEITAKIVPIAQALGTASGPYRYIGQLALDSEMGPQLLRHFSEHPDELKRLATLPESMRGLPQRLAVTRHTQWIVKEIGALERTLTTPAAGAPAAPAAASTVSAAPAPPPYLERTTATTNPKDAAFARGDIATWSKLDREEMLAKRDVTAR